MGNAGSSSDPAVFALDPFVGPVPLTPNSEVFESIMQARIGAELASSRDEILTSLCSQLATNNANTGNFQKLVRHVIARTKRVLERKVGTPADREVADTCTNGLFVVRVFLRHLVATAPDVVTLRVAHLSYTEGGAGEGSDGLVGELFRLLVDVVVDLVPSSALEAVITESCLLMLTLMSVQMYAPIADPPVAILAATLCTHYRAGELVHALVLHVVHGAGSGRGSSGPLPEPTEGSGLSTVLYLPWQLFSYLFSGGGAAGRATPPPSLYSAALCMLLVFSQELPSRLRAQLRMPRTPCAVALAALADDLPGAGKTVRAAPRGPSAGDDDDGDGDGGGDVGVDVEMVGGAPNSTGRGVPFSRLYAVVCSHLPSEGAVLFLYALLHSSRAFLHYVLSRADVDTLVVPLLHGLYTTVGSKTPSQAQGYMLLILLLMVSQDGPFMACAFRVVTPHTAWLRERRLGPMSVGSLIVNVLCRVMHANLNLAGARDPYVTTNCLATLANMSAHMKGLHAHTAQVYVSLYCRMAKRHAKLVARSLQQPSDNGSRPEPLRAPSEEDLSASLEATRILTEALNATLRCAAGRPAQHWE